MQKIQWWNLWSFKVYSLFKVDSQNAEQEAVDKLGTWRVCSVDKEADRSSVFLPGGLVLHIELAKRTSEDEHWERPDLLQNPEPAKVASAMVWTVLLNFTRPAVRSHVIIESSFSISAHSCCLQVPLILSELLTVCCPRYNCPHIHIQRPTLRIESRSAYTWRYYKEHRFYYAVVVLRTITHHCSVCGCAIPVIFLPSRGQTTAFWADGCTCELAP